MYNLQKIPSRTAIIDHKELLWFGGTSYLGMPHNAQFQELIKKGLDHCGSNWGSSRNNTLQLDIYENVESFLADFVKSPAALTVSSGMIAGQILLNYLKNIDPNTDYIFAPKVHPALWNSEYQSNEASFQDFIDNINTKIELSKAENITILVDSVPSPHFEKYDFEWVQNLPQDKNINLVIDDSHSLGVLGDKGGGIYSQIRVNLNVKVFVVASLNKALGVPGGVIFAEKQIIENIKRTAFFSGCSPMSPAFAFACANSKNIYSDALQALKKNNTYFLDKIKNISDFGNVFGHPAYNFGKTGLFEYLKNKNILVPSFGYPNPTDMPITRLVISSLHTQKDLDLLANTVLEFYQ